LTWTYLLLKHIAVDGFFDGNKRALGLKGILQFSHNSRFEGARHIKVVNNPIYQPFCNASY